MPPGRAGSPRLLLIHWLWRGGARSGPVRLGCAALGSAALGSARGAAVAAARSGRRAEVGVTPRRFHPARIPLSADSPGTGLRLSPGTKRRLGGGGVRVDVPGAGKRGEGTALRRGVRSGGRCCRPASPRLPPRPLRAAPRRGPPSRVGGWVGAPGWAAWKAPSSCSSARVKRRRGGFETDSWSAFASLQV